MNMYTPLPVEIEMDITSFIKKKFLDDELMKYLQEPIKEKVLELLDSLCVVIYYPLDEEDNNGFRLTNMPFLNGSRKDFVYINTAQTTEKQVFTAAHELGHIWEIDSYIFEQKEQYSFKLEETDREKIINRFAAILLMPKSVFKSKFNKLYDKSIKTKFAVLDLLRIIVILMDEFFAPYKSVVMRLNELGIIDETGTSLLLGDGDISKDDIEYVIQKIIFDLGFVQFQKPTMKKWIAGLAEMLDQAERENALPIEKINSVRTKFDLFDNAVASEMNNEVTIKRSEE